MKTMRNEYRDLKKENDLIFSTLAEYDRDTITEIISVVDNTRGIGYEICLLYTSALAFCWLCSAILSSSTAWGIPSSVRRFSASMRSTWRCSASAAG